MNKNKILIVDDEIKMCDILERFFCKTGYDVRSAYGGTEAIELLKNETFDFVLCNYDTPEAFGYDVAMSLDALRKRPKIGIITGRDELIDTSEREEMKVEFIMKKPVDFTELMKNIDDALNADADTN